MTSSAHPGTSPPSHCVPRRVALAALVSAATFAGSARATDETVLTLARGPEGAEAAAFSFAELAALPQTTIVTENEFSDGMVTYRGPLARDVIARLGLGDVAILRFVAANDYSVEIPTSDFRDYDVILALEANGATLSRREKGPLWLMYPISDHQELRDPAYIHRLIWQVVRIEIP